MNQESRIKNQGSAPRSRSCVAGFTLVELLVSMALFVVAISLVSAIFVRALRTQRITTALISINDNVSLALEQFAREVRTGYNFCATPCLSSELNFTNAQGVAVVYGITSSAFTRKEGAAPASAITADNISIASLSFAVIGASAGDGVQPRITISLKATSNNPIFGSSPKEVVIQTTISPRSPDS